jgi:hypothetical protein
MGAQSVSTAHDGVSLQDFIESHREKLIAMTRAKVEKRSARARPAGIETKHGVHLFLDQLRGALEDEAKRDPSQQAEPDPPTNPDIAETAALHGHDLLQLGFSVDEVVHDYGDVCQAVTELAVEMCAPITSAEFHTLNRCLDNAIAAAVTAWTEDLESKDDKLRRLVSGSLAIFAMLRDGRVGTGGSSAAMLGRQLEEMRDLLEEPARSGGTTATDKK